MLIISISFTLSQELTILLSLLGLNELHNAFILTENQEGNSAAGLYLSICMNLFFIVFLALCTYSNKIRAQIDDSTATKYNHILLKDHHY